VSSDGPSGRSCGSCLKAHMTLCLPISSTAADVTEMLADTISGEGVEDALSLAEPGRPVRIVSFLTLALRGTFMLSRNYTISRAQARPGCRTRPVFCIRHRTFTWERHSTVHTRLAAMVCKSVWAASNSRYAREVTASNDIDS
jgi:hypothetical protein